MQNGPQKLQIQCKGSKCNNKIIALHCIVVVFGCFCAWGTFTLFHVCCNADELPPSPSNAGQAPAFFDVHKLNF